MGVVGDADGGRVEVDAVCDDAVVGLWEVWGLVGEEAEEARVAVVEGAHGVEEVGYHAGAVGEGFEALFVGCVGVADGEDYVVVVVVR